MPHLPYIVRWPFRVMERFLAAAALAVDAYIHAHLADHYDAVAKSISQGDLFRVEAGLAAFGALLVLLWPRRSALSYAFLVSTGALALLLIYRYVDVGSLGPIPNMYEPIWFTEKVVAAIALGVAMLTTGHLRHSLRRL